MPMLRFAAFPAHWVLPACRANYSVPVPGGEMEWSTGTSDLAALFGSAVLPSITERWWEKVCRIAPVARQDKSAEFRYSVLARPYSCHR
jgi:hypothetical protein